MPQLRFSSRPESSIVSLIVLLCVCVTSSLVRVQTARAQLWEAVGYLPANGLHQVTDLSFFDEHTGFAIVDRRGVYRTDDGGGTWTAIAADQTRDARLVRFFDRDTGLIVDNWFGDGWHLKILRTTDGGATWGAAFEEHSSGSPVLLAEDAAFGENGIVFVTGMNAAVFKSADWGASWTHITVDVSGSDSTLEDWQGVACVGRTVWLSGVFFGYVARSTDAGETWQRVLTSPQGWGDIAANAAGTVCAVSVDAVKYSSDGGSTWLSSQLDSRLYSTALLSVALSDFHLPVISSLGDGAFTRTPDGQLTKLGTGLPDSASACPTCVRNTCWIVHPSHGSIYRTEILSAAPLSTGLPHAFSVAFDNGDLEVHRLSHRSEQLRVVDLLGRAIATFTLRSETGHDRLELPRLRPGEYFAVVGSRAMPFVVVR